MTAANACSPKCPSCGAWAATGGTFLLGQVFDDAAPKKGEQLRSAAYFVCCSCDTEFPLFTYTVGRPNSYAANATDDAGEMWDPAKGTTPWWEPASPLRGRLETIQHAAA